MTLHIQHTICIIKPDAFEHCESIAQRLAKEQFKIIKSFPFLFNRKEAEWFYQEHQGKPFFKTHIDFITSGECRFLLLSREHACGTLRELIGNTDPALAAPGTLRRLYGKGLPQNAVHGSANLESVRRETQFFLSGRELLQLTVSQEPSIQTSPLDE